jgi:hypothetical protein
MISEKRILANQINGKKSRGPQSWAGKMRVRYNAVRHGLSTIQQSNPVYANEIAVLVKALCEGVEEYPVLVEQAVLIAEGTVVLRYVRLEQAATIDRFRNRSVVYRRRPGGRIARARATGRLHKTSGGRTRRKVKERDEAEAMRAAMPTLKRLSRYERRAWSRRQRARRRFNEIRSQLIDYAEASAGSTANVHDGGDCSNSAPSQEKRWRRGVNGSGDVKAARNGERSS